jgi:hypothetical protein
MPAVDRQAFWLETCDVAFVVWTGVDPDHCLWPELRNPFAEGFYR